MLWALIMVGGSGTRLWPLSDAENPKPFLKLVPKKKSLIEETVARIHPVVPLQRVLLIGNVRHRKRIQRLFPQIPKNQIIGEPISKNTAVVVAIAASIAKKADPNASLIVLPADHWIDNSKSFRKVMRTAMKQSVLRKTFAIFGVSPRFPSTSYGYVLTGKKIGPHSFELRKFVEKPDKKKAERFVKDRRYFWHAGIFLAQADVIIDSFNRFCPAMMKIAADKLKIRHSVIGPRKTFDQVPNISMDYAVLEKLTSAVLVTGNYGWCDVGTWQTVSGLWDADPRGNAVIGNGQVLEGSGNMVYAEGRPTFVYGVNDLAIINTGKATLITTKNTAEAMRHVVQAAAGKKKR